MGLLAANAWLILALIADVTGLATGLSAVDRVLDRLLVPVLGVGVVAQIRTGALTFLLPVTVGGSAGNRRLTASLERGWRIRAVLGNIGVAALVSFADGGWPRIAAWAAVLAGFGTFPAFAGTALMRAHAGNVPPARQTPVASEQVPDQPLTTGHAAAATRPADFNKRSRRGQGPDARGREPSG